MSWTAPEGTFWLCYRGSLAHDTSTVGPNADIDLMGFAFGEPRHYFGLTEWGSRGTMEIKEGLYDVVFYEIRKAFTLLLQGNPNIFAMLWTGPEATLLTSPAAQRIMDNRHLFAGKHIYDAFAGSRTINLLGWNRATRPRFANTSESPPN